MPVIRRNRDSRSIGLLREDSCLIIHNPRFAKKRTGEKFEIKSYLPNKFFGDRTVQVYRDFYRTTNTSYCYSIVKLKIRINHRVETCQMTGRIRVRKIGNNSIGGYIHFTTSLCRNRLPLSGGLFQTYVAISCDSVSMHDDTNATLMSFRVNVVKCHYIHTAILKITRRIKLKFLGVGKGTRTYQCPQAT